MARPLPIKSFGPEAKRLLTALGVDCSEKVRKVQVTFEVGAAVVVTVERFLTDEQAEAVEATVIDHHFVCVPRADG